MAWNLTEDQMLSLGLKFLRPPDEVARIVVEIGEPEYWSMKRERMERLCRFWLRSYHHPLYQLMEEVSPVPLLYDCTGREFDSPSRDRGWIFV